jgi:molybdenum cofactor cytidylyltransferase
MLAALILAAGASTRMGSAKPLLSDREGRPFVVRLARTFAAAALSEIVVVTAAEHDAVAAALLAGVPSLPVRVVRNPDPSRGQLSSLWTGLDAVATLSPEAVLVAPVDVPLIDPTTITQVIDGWRRTHAPVVRPASGERHGHPVLFDRLLFHELRAAPLDVGARAVVRAHAADILNVPVEDEGCLVDIDTPDDYERLIGGD